MPAKPSASPAKTPAPGPQINVRQIADDSGVAVEAYDTYDTDEETLAAAHRFAAGILNRLAQICDAPGGPRQLDAAALRRMAVALNSAGLN